MGGVPRWGGLAALLEPGNMLSGLASAMTTDVEHVTDSTENSDLTADSAVVDETSPVGERLRVAGVRPTRQRLALAELLFGKGDRHITAEQLHLEAVEAGERVSLATVYNTLHQLRAAGLVRELAIDGQRAYFDTNTSDHCHFFIEPEGDVVDIPSGPIRVNGLPAPPAGYAISHVDIVVRVKKL
ncbi:MAG: hypothetical protein RL291_214 [Pseudomonadota bacterium]